MPTYEYQCTKCGSKFELFQSMKDAPLTTCTKEVCHRKPWGRGRVKRLLGTGAGLIFKGSGFYITDYRDKSYHEAAKKDSKPAESKPAAEAPKPAKKESKSTKKD